MNTPRTYLQLLWPLNNQFRRFKLNNNFTKIKKKTKYWNCFNKKQKKKLILWQMTQAKCKYYFWFQNNMPLKKPFVGHNSICLIYLTTSTHNRSNKIGHKSKSNKNLWKEKHDNFTKKQKENIIIICRNCKLHILRMNLSELIDWREQDHPLRYFNMSLKV